MADGSNDKRAGAKTRLPQEAEAQAVRDKTARLRALRLAHEAATKPAVDKVVRPSARKKEPAAKAVPLSDWLDGQDQQGRRK
jgi:hypothetical protein